MTRAELNDIKARMYDQILKEVDNGISDQGLHELLGTQSYVVMLLNQVMEEQVEQARQAGY